MSLPKRILLWVMGIFYVFGGVNHFVRSEFYLPMMPPYLPWHEGLVYLSGLAEIVLGIGVLLPFTRPLAAWGVILLLIAIFPANIHIALHNIPVFGAQHGAGVWNWVRLPFQLVLIAWAWWYTRAEPLAARPPSERAAPRPSVSKPAILRRMDRLARDRAVMEAALRDLREKPSAPLLDLGLMHQYVEKAGDEAEHLRKDWFDAEHGWWKHLPAIEPVLRAAFIKAGELAIEHNLPVDCYWIQRGDDFEVAVTRSDAQITMLFLSPLPPIPFGGGAAKLTASDRIMTFRPEMLGPAQATGQATVSGSA